MKINILAWLISIGTALTIIGCGSSKNPKWKIETTTNGDVVYLIDDTGTDSSYCALNYHNEGKYEYFDLVIGNSILPPQTLNKLEIIFDNNEKFYLDVYNHPQEDKKLAVYSIHKQDVSNTTNIHERLHKANRFIIKLYYPSDTLKIKYTSSETLDEVIMEKEWE